MSKPHPSRKGEIWLLDFDPTVGDEIRKTRPALVINEDGMALFELRIVVPITHWESWRAGSPWYTLIKPTKSNGLSKESGADGSQIKSVSTNRFIKKLGVVTPNQLNEVRQSVLLCIGA